MKNNVHVIFEDGAKTDYCTKKPKELEDIQSDEVCKDVEDYILWHEEAGFHLDTECISIRFSPETVITLHMDDGIWIIDSFTVKEDDDEGMNENGEKVRIEYKPVYIWKRIVEGVRTFIRKVCVAWQLVKQIVKQVLKA